ncbi:MAG: hypothetical protein GF350_04610 [Chitinivibrionales bacterium]|nr:hypothetical protein [Chitinivibrionales bacterium]
MKQIRCRRFSACIFAVSFFTAAFCQTRIACVGNSITAGSGLSYSQKWPTRLQVLLGSDYLIKNCGHSMRAVLKESYYPYWESEWFDTTFAFLPDTVLLMLGTNDCKERDWVYNEDFRSDYNALLDTLMSMESSPQIVIMLPPPIARDQWDMLKLVLDTAIVPIIADIAQTRGIPVIDIHTLFTGHEQEWLADGVHPNDEGAMYIAQAAYSSLTGTFSARYTSATQNRGMVQNRFRRSVVLSNDNMYLLPASVPVPAFNLLGKRFQSSQTFLRAASIFIFNTKP